MRRSLPIIVTVCLGLTLALVLFFCLARPFGGSSEGPSPREEPSPAPVISAEIPTPTPEPSPAAPEESAPAAPSIAQAQHERFQAIVDVVAEKYGAVGLQAAVIEQGRVTDAYTYGWADKEAGIRMTTDHKIRVASITKPVIAMLAMAMADDGSVDLDASIGRYWGLSTHNPYYPDAPVSIRTILSQTSSIPAYSLDTSRTYETVRSLLAGNGYQQREPGALSAWAYNNYAFGVLGMTLELAKGQLLDQIADTYFFDALDIDATFASGELDEPELLAALYERDDTVSRSVADQREIRYPGAPGADGVHFSGGLTISSVDLAKLVAVVAGGGTYESRRFLSDEAVEAMLTSIGTPADAPFEQCYPFRLVHDACGRADLYTHGGSNYGTYTYLFFDPHTGDGVVVLTTGAKVTKEEHGLYEVCSEIADPILRALA